MTGKYRNVTDNIHGLIRLTDLESRVAEHPVFNRLHYVYQNSSAYLTWPSMRNRRFEHSLGAMKLAGDMLNEAVQNADTQTIEVFYLRYSKAIAALVSKANRREIDAWDKESGTNLLQHINRMLGEGDSTGADLRQSKGYCSLLIPSVVPERWQPVHNVLVRAVRLTGMLHDLGHPPFSHVCEAALKELYEYSLSIDDPESVAKGYREAIESLCGGKNVAQIDLHEAVGEMLVGLTIEDACRNVRESGDVYLTAIYFSIALVVRAIIGDEGVFRDLHVLVSGTVDADRMDYVQRDSVNAGFGTDALQYARLIEGMRIVRRERRTLSGSRRSASESESFVFAMPVKALPTVEAFLRKRLENYRTIIYHHRVVKSGAFMRDTVVELASAKMAEKAGNIDSLRLPDDVSGLWIPLVKNINGTKDTIRAFSQWNDSWLINMLSGEYLTCSYGNSAPDMLRRAKLGELLYSEKAYQSLVKRSSDCMVFRNHLRELLDGDSELKTKVIEYFIKASMPSGSGNRGKQGANKLVNELFRMILHDSRGICRSLKTLYGFFSTVQYHGKAFDSYEDLFEAMFEEALGELDVSYVDFFVEWNGIKPGVGDASGGVFFYYDDSPNELVSLEAASGIRDELLREIEDMPLAFIYLLPKSGEMLDRAKVDELMRLMAVKHLDYIRAVVCSLDDVVEK